MSDERIEVQRTIPAGPADVFPVLSEGPLRATPSILDRTVRRGLS